VRGPVGSLGNPDDDRDYVLLEKGKISIYVEKAIIDELPDDGGQIDVSFGGFGKKAVYISKK
jgi:hypothetical protein